MVAQSNWNYTFEKRFKSYFIKPGTLKKIETKHTVYQKELEEALGDPCWVVRKNNKPAPLLPDGRPQEGETFDIFCTTLENRLLKVVGRLYESGNFQIITVLSEGEINVSDRKYHIQEKEKICNE
ncbi:hypothetical protein U8V72_14415 [Priestia filamentosa]|uniref:hypothetical protein n=1 Tax=Priestia filamentosa TaxID=1402861 RepID=UPI0005891FFB